MGYEIIRGPFMLLETVAMLYKFVNGISFQSAINRQRFFMDSAAIADQDKKMERLQEIMREVCADVDPKDPFLQRYFFRASTDQEHMCLAQLMTYTFCTLREPDFWGNVQEICKLWQDLQRRGYWIRSEPETSLVFTFTNAPGCPGNLYKQIKALSFPSDFRLEIYDAFQEFEKSLQELAAYIEPLSQRLQKAYSQEAWMFDETERYWHEAFQKKSIVEFVSTFADEAFIQRMGDRTVVAILLMDSNLLTAEAAESPLGLGYNILYIGSAIPSNGLPRHRGGDLETVGYMLKSISDKKRLEILQRLSREPSYGLELADIMGMDSGHMSRILAQMHSYGFLREEKDRLRVYYQTDREVIHNFLEMVEATIFSK